MEVVVSVNWIFQTVTGDFFREMNIAYNPVLNIDLKRKLHYGIDSKIRSINRIENKSFMKVENLKVLKGR